MVGVENDSGLEMDNGQEQEAIISELRQQIADLEAQNKELVLQNEALRDETRRDALTGLLKLKPFLEAIAKAAVPNERRIEQRNGDAVAFVDFNNMKELNELIGHRNVDKVLAAVAKRLKILARQTDHVARLGGDEFGVFLTNTDPQTAGVSYTRRIINSFREDPIVLNLEGVDREIPVNFSIGVEPLGAISSEAPEEEYWNIAEKAIDSADNRMHKGKSSMGSYHNETIVVLPGDKEDVILTEDDLIKDNMQAETA